MTLVRGVRLCVCCAACAMGADRIGTLDRPRTLGGGESQSIESIRAEQAAGRASLDFGSVWDAPATSERGWNLGDSLSPLWIDPLAALEWRLMGDTDQVWAGEGGVFAHGAKGALRFYTDARIFSERHDQPNSSSWDGEVVDHSVEGNRSNLTFTSYARYKGAVEWDSRAGRFGLRREAPHWGPGMDGNLVLNRQAIPFPHAYWRGEFGSASIEALWGRLTIDGVGDYRRTHRDRSIYAHRYEWRPSSDFQMGVSELLILYDQESITGVIPFVPLFIEKGEVAERESNGNIAFDAAYRRFGTLFYGEFLVDDLQEPSSLFSDGYWGNRWAALVGFWHARKVFGHAFGAGLEWTRIEPWVYTHFSPQTAQALNQGVPLGNPDGPNTQALRAKLRLGDASVGVSIFGKATWRGTDSGSSVTDTAPSDPGRGKTFLGGVDAPRWSGGVEGWKDFGAVSLQGWVGADSLIPFVRLRVLVRL